MALAPQQFCVKWNSYHTNLQAVFPRLLSTEHFADVTLACENRQIRCHKLVLSACSAYFERLLVQNPCKHPIVFMKDMRFSEMQALVDFMYKGEVNVTQDELPSLLKSAEALQIRGLCSGESGGITSDVPSAGKQSEGSKDFTLATEALLAQAQKDTSCTSTGSQQSKCTGTSQMLNGTSKKRKSEERDAPRTNNSTSTASTAATAEVKEETVEEDGLYYGELDHDQMEFNEDEESGKPGSSLSQPSDYAIANVQCQYDSGSEPDMEAGSESITITGVRAAVGDHTYDAPDPTEPPAFVIKQVQSTSGSGLITHTVKSHPFVELNPKPASLQCSSNLVPAVNVIHLVKTPEYQQQPEYSMSKRIRRSEVVLKQAADCVSRGLTFQTVSDQFNIPISTIRFFMARKGILPRRRRGRNSQVLPLSNSPEPPFHMQHYKLPEMIALKADGDDEPQPPA